MVGALSNGPLAMPALREALPKVGLRRLQVGMRMLCDFGIVQRDRRGRFSTRERGASGVDQIAASYESRSSDDRETLQAMLDYARSGSCRWVTLLAYYGETADPQGCGICDSCKRMDEVATKTLSEQKVPAVRAESVRFTKGDVVRARRFGEGVVVFASEEWVEVRFTDDSVRRFLPTYLRQANNRSGQNQASM